MRYMLYLGMILLVLGASMPVRGHSEAPATLNDDWWGMVVRDPLYEWNTHPDFPDQVNRIFIDTMLDTLQAAGVDWVRFEFHGTWGPDYGTINLAQAEYFIQAAHAREMKVLALIGTDILRGPAAQVQMFDAGTVSGDYPPEIAYCVDPDPWQIGCGVNEYMQAWLERALTLALHYRGSIDAYEIFNEPNFYFALRNETNATQDEMNPLHVARAMTKFQRIIRNQGDQTPVLVGGIHPMTSQESGRTDRTYLHALYQSEPFQGYHAVHGAWPVQGVAYHPYPAEMRRIIDDLAFLPLVGPRVDELLHILHSYDPQARLWMTEVGTRGAPDDPEALRKQAVFLREMALILYARRKQLGPWFWFKYEDFPDEPWGVVAIPFDAQGSYDITGTITLYKPAYSQYQSLALGLRPRVWLPLIKHQQPLQSNR